MRSSEWAKVSLAKRRIIFAPEQIDQTIAAATEPYRTMFTVAALRPEGRTGSGRRRDHL
jgi:hypothetical protein